jgi:hypothetical protein
MTNTIGEMTMEQMKWLHRSVGYILLACAQLDFEAACIIAQLRKFAIEAGYDKPLPKRFLDRLRYMKRATNRIPQMAWAQEIVASMALWGKRCGETREVLAHGVIAGYREDPEPAVRFLKVDLEGADPVPAKGEEIWITIKHLQKTEDTLSTLAATYQIFSMKMMIEGVINFKALPELLRLR